MRLLDANEFITAKNSYYGTGFAPGFWQWISQDYIANDLRAIGAVREELIAQEDELAAWSRELPADFWLEETDADVPSLRSLAAWTMSGDSRFVQQARTDFLATADYRLVAQAHAGGHVVVTHEVAQPEGKKRIKIPDACAAFGVEVREPFGIFRELGLKLVRPS
ncbi:DUF4411 family protein [Glaciibacter flavus]|uniref:DUF4411 family protein n=1 Tax=Orlajensenia flava TaxID=2565934 RepID=UPI003B00819C